MSHKAQKAVKIGVTTAVLATAFGVLFYTTLTESMHLYKYVDEIMVEPSEWMDTPLQVHGYVVPGTIETKRQTLEYKFDVRRNGKTMPAYFRGATPDGFVADAEVVLTGRLGEDGTFVATAMSAKCPSKYEEAPLASTAR